MSARRARLALLACFALFSSAPALRLEFSDAEEPSGAGPLVEVSEREGNETGISVLHGELGGEDAVKEHLGPGDVLVEAVDEGTLELALRKMHMPKIDLDLEPEKVATSAADQAKTAPDKSLEGEAAVQVLHATKAGDLKPVKGVRGTGGAAKGFTFFPAFLFLPGLVLGSLVAYGIARASAHEVPQRRQSNSLDGALNSACESRDVAEEECEQLQVRHLTLRRTVHCKPAEELGRELMSTLEGARLGGSACDREAKGMMAPVGLAPATVESYRRIFGANRLTPPEQESIFLALLGQIFGGLFNILLWICIAAQVGLAFCVHEDFVTPIILALVVVVSGVLQWWTEQQAQSQMDSLMSMQTVEEVTIFRQREGRIRVLPEEILPGDVLVLEAGQRVPADVRILDCTDGALVDNAAITGEAVPEPRTEALAPEGSMLLESKNIAFSGTSVVQGRLLCVVYGTGDQTLLGTIAAKIRGTRPRSSLEVQIEHFVHIIAMIAIFVGLLSLSASYLAPGSRRSIDILRNSATAVFAQVPEGLLPTVTVSLMIACHRMVTKKVVVRRIDAIETLGCISVLCSDKTGTLTSGEMTVTDLVLPCTHDEKDGETGSWLRCMQARDFKAQLGKNEETLAEGGILNSSATSSSDGSLRGSPTEVAIGRLCSGAFESGSVTVHDHNPHVFDIPFNGSNKWMLTIHRSTRDGKQVFRAILKGAPERVLQYCALGEEKRKAVDVQLQAFMREGKRLICVAEKLLGDLPGDFAFKGSCAEDANFDFGDFGFVGLFVIEDPPRADSRTAVERLRGAGVVTIMVTGDHPCTARAIAERCGILPPASPVSCGGEEYTVVTGAMIEHFVPPGDFFDLSGRPGEDQRLLYFWRKCLQDTRVFARVSPMHKRTIVQMYQQLGKHIVAMTGDGVNDAPALKEAEVGIAMGIRGTEVAKEAGDIILLEDDLLSVCDGVEQGRLCSDNLRKSIMYTLCSKLPQLLPSFAVVWAVPSALTAAQVLLVDIGTDIWTAIAFAWQPMEKDLMKRQPRHPTEERMVNGSVLIFSYIYIGMLQALICWALFLHMPRMLGLAMESKSPDDYSADDQVASMRGSTMYYWALICGQVGAGLATTTTRQSLFTYGLPNHALNLCIVLELVLGLAVVYWEPLNTTFRTKPLDQRNMLLAMGAIVVIVTVEEGRKYYLRGLDAAQPEGRRSSVRSQSTRIF
eukprot:TRINITY_DN31639_c0_g2_i1.p1 TRINITY_DN31639_c0_g2~~TRINITY_DN31639_c0_g2_i1.p1  ORF type:complete len:1205 (-),score=289.21 TRINITY_DN31639_c0_g2_i1:262-3876(-)